MNNHVRRFPDVLVAIGIVSGLTATDSVFADASSHETRLPVQGGKGGDVAKRRTM